MKHATIKLNYYELGALRASIKPDQWKLLPRSVQLKIEIPSTEAYTSNDYFGSQAKEDLKRMKKELKELPK